MGKKFEVSEFALEAVRHFEFSGTLINVRPFGNGHINDTFLLTVKQQEKEVPYVFQRINQDVFLKPQVIPESRSITSSADIPSTREAIALRLPLHPP